MFLTFHDGGRYQTGFCMISASVMKRLRRVQKEHWEEMDCFYAENIQAIQKE